MISGRCDSCKFWKKLTEHKGECRVNSPRSQAFPGHDGAPVIFSYFPPSDPKSWCGEFEIGIALMEAH